MGMLYVKRFSLDEAKLVFPSSQTRNVVVSHALKRCTIARFGKAHYGDMTNGIRACSSHILKKGWWALHHHIDHRWYHSLKHTLLIQWSQWIWCRYKDSSVGTFANLVNNSVGRTSSSQRLCIELTTKVLVDGVVEGWFGHTPCIEREHSFWWNKPLGTGLGDHRTHRKTCHILDHRGSFDTNLVKAW